MDVGCIFLGGLRRAKHAGAAFKPFLLIYPLGPGVYEGRLGYDGSLFF